MEVVGLNLFITNIQDFSGHFFGDSYTNCGPWRTNDKFYPFSEDNIDDNKIIKKIPPVNEPFVDLFKKNTERVNRYSIFDF